MRPILIVEDEPAIADLIEMTLEPLGQPLIKAHTGNEAANLLESTLFDLILLDVMLPCVNWKEPDISCAIRDAIKAGGSQIPSMSSMNSPSQICPSRIRLHQIRKTRIW